MTPPFRHPDLPPVSLAPVSQRASRWPLVLALLPMLAVAGLVWRVHPSAPVVIAESPTSSADPWLPTVAAQLAVIEANQATATATPTRTPLATRTATPPVTDRYRLCDGAAAGVCVLPSPTWGALPTLPVIPSPTLPACPTWVSAPGYPTERLCHEGGR